MSKGKYANYLKEGEIEGYYYLHTNGDLIFKRNLDGTYFDLMESDFVKRFWPFVASQRGLAWAIVAEAKALGADESRIKTLKEKWNLTDKDAPNFAERMGIRLEKDGDQWCAVWQKDFANIQECDAGFGEDALTAFSELAKFGLVGKET